MRIKGTWAHTHDVVRNTTARSYLKDQITTILRAPNISVGAVQFTSVYWVGASSRCTGKAAGYACPSFARTSFVYLHARTRSFLLGCVPGHHRLLTLASPSPLVRSFGRSLTVRADVMTSSTVHHQPSTRVDACTEGQIADYNKDLSDTVNAAGSAFMLHVDGQLNPSRTHHPGKQCSYDCSWMHVPRASEDSMQSSFHSIYCSTL